MRSWRTWGITGGMVPWSRGHGWKKGPGAEEQVKSPDLGESRYGTYFDTVKKEWLMPYEEPAWTTLPGGEALLASNGPTLAWIAGPKKAFMAKDHSFNGGQEVEKQVVFINDLRSGADYRGTVTVTVGTDEVFSKEFKGRIANAANDVPYWGYVDENDILG